MGIGLIGANIVKEIPDAEVELFKYPSDLDEALGRRIPNVFGISNYSWNSNLGQAYAKRIKERYPRCVVICGGPNYGSTAEEERDFWTRFPWTDFYVYKEGERVVVQLLKVLAARDWCVQGVSVPSCHTLQKESGEIQKQALAPRVKSLDDLPSPYTAGLMDKFFDGVLIPMTHTTRGCPFKCTFCTEGTQYYDQVAKRTTLAEDLDYIGQRVGTVQDLYISDANFGMFKEDRDKALAIAESQKRYNWPRYIHVSGGKNHKERLLEVASIIGGSMGVAASLQSTNKNVLDNVRRSNISLEQLTGVARQGSRIDANTYAEIILNLPGDTLEAHTQSLRDAVNSGLSYIRMYQLIMLPETDMNTRETREKFGMKTMWRIMPRCFGKYSFQGEEFNCAEIEEICVAQDSLSFSDYIEARKLDLTIEIAHNSNIFRELFGLCSVAGIEWFDLLLAFHRRKGNSLHDLYTKFEEDTIKPLWASRDEAVKFAQTNLDLYLTEQMGTNELFNAKAVAFFNMQQELHDAIYAEAQQMMPQYGEYLEEAKSYSLQRKQNLLDVDSEETRYGNYTYDFQKLLDDDFSTDPILAKSSRSRRFDFSHTREQKQTIDQLVHQYGTSTTGLGRILLRAHIKRLFRQVNGSAKGFEQSYRRASNLYGD